MKLLHRNKGVAALAVGLAAVMFAAGCERPPPESVQRGYRGTGMVDVFNPRILDAKVAANIPPEATPPIPDEPGAAKAGDIYQNVEVLGDLNVGQFMRLMTAMTSWVAPEEGCNYCHVEGNFAAEDKYTKGVSRSMLKMTRNANSAWNEHVGDTGVTCYTCHRGKHIPEYVWSEHPGVRAAGGMARTQTGQNIVAEADAVGYTSLPYDPFTEFLWKDEDIRVIPETALPSGYPMEKDTRYTEKTYALMMHFSQALGVNCTHCHNTRSFQEWSSSPEQRTTAWHAIRHVREMNQTYVEPLTGILPAARKGPLGDALKINCATCHQGAYKPLFGARMFKDYPSLGKDASG